MTTDQTHIIVHCTSGSHIIEWPLHREQWEENDNTITGLYKHNYSIL